VSSVTVSSGMGTCTPNSNSGYYTPKIKRTEAKDETVQQILVHVAICAEAVEPPLQRSCCRRTRHESTYCTVKLLPSYPLDSALREHPC